MDSSKENELEARLAKVEQSIALLQRSVDSLVGARSSAHERRADIAQPSGVTRMRPPAPQPFPGERFSAWLSSRTQEWWLSRLGIGFVILAVLLLYRYAIDKGWITPPVRVLAGAVSGATLFWLASRAKPSVRSNEPRELGLREVFYGGALAVWYVTAYAASVWYQLISIPTARVAFLALGIVSTWISLRERRDVFAFLAVATSFATPFILTGPVAAGVQLSLYLATATAMGLVIYLMRGWPSIIWITFAGFWLSIAGVANTGSGVNRTLGSLTIAVVVLLAAAAFVCAPALRRHLLLLGSERYTPFPLGSGMMWLMDGLDSLSEMLGGGKGAPDSLVIWVLPLVTPILAVNFLEGFWPGVPSQLWGFLLLVLGAAAFSYSRRAEQTDPEVTHVAVTAAVLWTVLGIGPIAPAPEGIPLAAFIATLVLLSSTRFHLGGRLVAKATIAFALMTIAGHNLSFADVGLMRLRWVLSGIATVGCAGLIAQTLIEEPAEKMQGRVLAIGAYLTGLVVIWRALEPIWPPLVTTSYAILGAVILILSRRVGANPMLKQLGGVTMLIVVARLLLVDLSTVETIWRVLLFLVCGALFLYTGYRMQLRPAGETDK